MMSLKTLMMNHLRLDDAEKRLGNRVVPAVTLTTHTLDEPMLVEHLPEIFTGILNTTIRMDDQSFSRSAALDCSMKCHLDHLASQRTAESPAYDHSRKKIQKYRQIQPAMFGGDVCNIRDPHRVRRTGREIALKKIRSNRVRMLRISRWTILASDNRSKSGLFHPSGNTIFANLKAVIVQLPGNLRAATASLGNPD